MDRIEEECHRFLGSSLPPPLRDEVIADLLSGLRKTQRNTHWWKAFQDAQQKKQLRLSNTYEDDPAAMNQCSLLPNSKRIPALYHRVEMDGENGIYRTVTVRIMDESLVVEELATLPTYVFRRTTFCNPEEVVQHLRVYYPNLVIPPVCISADVRKQDTKKDMSPCCFK